MDHHDTTLALPNPHLGDMIVSVNVNVSVKVSVDVSVNDLVDTIGIDEMDRMIDLDAGVRSGNATTNEVSSSPPL